MPGGHPEPGESLDDTIARELMEEAGLHIPGLIPLAVVENTDADGRTTSRVQVYTGTWDGDPALLPLTEGIMLRFTDAEQIPYLTMDPGTTAVIRHHQEGPRPDGGAADALPVLRLRDAVTKTVPNVIGVHLYLERDGEILLGLRHPDSAYAPLEHHFLAGHCERESAISCLIGEACEEAGLVIKVEDVELVHAVHLVDSPRRTAAPPAGLPSPPMARRTPGPGAGQVRQLGLVARRRSAGADRHLHPGRHRRHPARPPLHRTRLDLTRVPFPSPS
ncbi:NUDIX hydrolase [Streptomyces europaeiscabiei]|uniref:NUDIX hydrolase n=1 Tax=Streptomyces europaeiscabiei TaxID=146819 RepID=UPI0029AE750F|nr:NUDIX hydrolase [Streptomyces europaeiscabiei]WSG28462.1 NUDIX hydrolase [Streptomyces europaeiscabiei]